jgi:ABC-type branched-subunit amino acid transport system substrate-binding protein
MNRACLLVAFAALGCQGNNRNASQIAIGAVTSESGPHATVGVERLHAIELALDEINGAGGVLGKTLVVADSDDHSDDTAAAAAAMTLIDDHHVPAIIGPLDSNAAVAELPVVTAAQIVLISGSATSPALTGASPFFFRTCGSDALQGKLLAKRAAGKAFPHQRVGIIHLPGAYGEGLADAFATSYAELGGTIMANLTYVEKQPSYVGLLSQLFSGDPPDAILLIAFDPEASQIIKDYVRSYLSTLTFWFFTDSTYSQIFVNGVGASNFTFPHEGTGAAIPTSQTFASFASEFNRRFGQTPESFTANYYDATYLVALALERGRRVDGPSIRDNLRAVANPPATRVMPGQWALAKAALDGNMDVNYDGASGDVDLDANGEVPGLYDIWKVDSATAQFVIIDHSVSP